MVKESKTNYELYMESPEALAKAFVSVYISGMQAAADLSSNEIEVLVGDTENVYKLVNSYYNALMSPVLNYYGIVD